MICFLQTWLLITVGYQLTEKQTLPTKLKDKKDLKVVRTKYKTTCNRVFILYVSKFGSNAIDLYTKSVYLDDVTV